MDDKPKTTFDREMLDPDFKKTFESEYQNFIHAHEAKISSDTVFKELTNKYTKAGTFLHGLRVSC